MELNMGRASEAGRWQAVMQIIELKSVHVILQALLSARNTWLLCETNDGGMISQRRPYSEGKH